MSGREGDRERLARYVRRFMERRGRSEMPTVRHTARSLNWTQERVMRAAEDAKDWSLGIDIVGYNVEERESDADLWLEFYEWEDAP